MITSQLLEELKRLTVVERLAFLEAALHSLYEDLQPVTPAQSAKKQQMSVAAQALLQDYTANGELTVFTALDSEDFRA